MPQQNYSNHRRYVPGYHLVTAVLLFAFLGGTINNAVRTTEENSYLSYLLVLLSIILLLFYWYLRAFALRAQDRAIRAEEQFRHFILTNKPLDSNLRMSQIIALRFASDEEFPSLAQQAVKEKLSADAIKRSIRNWRADWNRV